MSDSILIKLEKFLDDEGYYDLEFQGLTEDQLGNLVYTFFGMTDDHIQIDVLINKEKTNVSVYDQYLDDNNLVLQSSFSYSDLF